MMNSLLIFAAMYLAASVANGAPPQRGAIAESETELVLGVEVRRQRNCRVELNDYVTPAGEMFGAYSCLPSRPEARHPYFAYDDDTLALMAWSDADAAEQLGRRLLGHDLDRSRQYMLRATALDGDISRIDWFAEQAFGTVAVNGIPQVGNLERRYELAELAARLGGDPIRAGYLRNQLMQLGVNARQLHKCANRAAAMMESMRAVQALVRGRATLGGNDDA